MEAISQYFLYKQGIDNEKPDYSLLTEEQLGLFKSVLRGNPGEEKNLPDKIDLKLGFWLLRTMEHPIKDKVFKGDLSFKHFTFEKILANRNSSILAHGFKPIGKERAEKFHKNLQILLEQAFGSAFQEVKKKLQLPIMPEIGF